MPIIEQDEFGSFLKEAIPGRKRRLEEDPDPVPVLGFDINALAEQLNNQADSLYPVNPLSPEEQERFGSLAARNERLQPAGELAFGEVGSSRIPGNPFSVDTRGAARGVGNFILGLVNKERDRRRGEFEGELGGLVNQQRQNITNEEAQQEFFNEFFPNVLTQAGQNVRNTADNESLETRNTEDNQRMRDINNAEIKAEASQNELDRKHDIALEKLRNKNKESFEQFKTDLEKSNPDNISPSLITGFARNAEETGSSLIEEANNKEEILNDPVKLKMFENAGGDSEKLKKEIDHKRRQAFESLKVASEAFRGNVSDDLVGRMNKVYDDLVPGGNAENNQISPRNLRAMPQNPEERRNWLRDTLRTLQNEFEGGRNGTGEPGSSSGVDVGDLFPEVNN